MQLPVVELKDSRGALPLYEQLYLELRNQTLRGRLRQGARLASTRTLAGHLSVSRFTVVTALERLLAEAYLTTRAGSGTYITQTLPEHVMRPDIGVARRRFEAMASPLHSPSEAIGCHRSGSPFATARGAEAFQPRRAPLDLFPIRTS